MNIDDYIRAELEARKRLAIGRAGRLEKKSGTKDIWYVYAGNIGTFHKTRYAMQVETFFGEKFMLCNDDFSTILDRVTEHVLEFYDSLPLYKKLTYLLSMDRMHFYTLDEGSPQIVVKFAPYTVDHITFYQSNWEAWLAENATDVDALLQGFRNFADKLYFLLTGEEQQISFFNTEISLTDLTIIDFTNTTSLAVNGTEFRVNFYPIPVKNELTGVVILEDKPVRSNLAEILLKINKALTNRGDQ